jgi:hypothetical protein
MEHGFGAEFSRVKVHVDDRAAGLARQLNARAFTIGNDVFFNRGEFRPQQTDGKRLLAHELSHVVQQRGSLAVIRRKEGIEDRRPTAHSIAVVVAEKGESVAEIYRRGIQETFKLSAAETDEAVQGLSIVKNGVPFERIAEGGELVPVQISEKEFDRIKAIHDRTHRSKSRILPSLITGHGTFALPEFVGKAAEFVAVAALVYDVIQLGTGAGREAAYQWGAHLARRGRLAAEHGLARWGARFRGIVGGQGASVKGVGGPTRGGPPRPPGVTDDIADTGGAIKNAKKPEQNTYRRSDVPDNPLDAAIQAKSEEFEKLLQEFRKMSAAKDGTYSKGEIHEAGRRLSTARRELKELNDQRESKLSKP